MVSCGDLPSTHGTSAGTRMELEMRKKFSWFDRPHGNKQDSLSRDEGILEARAIAFTVEAQKILDGVSITSGQGEFTGLVGPNGAGKSTLIRCISGLLARTGGSVALDGLDLVQLAPREVARVIAHLPQNSFLDYGFTSLEAVLMGRNPHLGPFQFEGTRDHAVARAAMTFTDTERLAGRNMDSLSGGERQRVLMARALAQEPRLLLLDEPTANLDIQHQLQLMALVRGLVERGMGALAAMHDLNMASAYCDRIYMIKAGQIVASGPPEEVLQPALLRTVFDVATAVDTHPVTGKPRVNFYLDEAATPDFNAAYDGRKLG